MLDRILLATDLSEESASAWHIAIVLAQRSTRPALCVLHIFDIPSAYVDIDGAGLVPRLYEDSRRSAEEEMRRYGALCRASGIEMRPVERLGNPVESIVKTARDENAELIVLGIRHAGVIDRLLGRSIVGQVARMAPCHVLCVKPR